MLTLDDLRIQPGMYTIDTDRGAGKIGRWKDGDKVRFHKGMPQKIGGWQKSSSDTFLGTCRKLTDWLTLSFEKLISAGTHLKLYVWKGGTFYDVTPIRSSGTLGADPFATTNGSAVVTVTHTSHGALASDFVTYGGASAVAGITIDGEYQIDSVVDADHYKITHSAAANATTTGGGAAVTYEYQINTGSDSSIYGQGWGSGTWSESTWGTPRTVAQFFAYARIWSLDQWGEDLIASPRSGGLYVWDASAGTGTRATAISGAPSTARAVLVSQQNKHLVALGAHDGTADNPMLIRWCSSEDYTDWTPSSTNSAGKKLLNTGNEILCGVKASKEILVYTDSNLWTMTFSGSPNWFDFEDKGANGQIRGPNAAAELDGVTYWMGEKNFFFYDGRVNELPCDVWPTVFENINYVQRYKTYAAVNRLFGEIWWLYCSAASSSVDRYVIYRPSEKTWAFGTLARTAMVGDSDLFTVPYATGTNGYLYDHETGTDDDTVAMTAYIASGDIEIGTGDQLLQIGSVVPDFKTLTGSVTLTLSAKKYPQSSSRSSSASIEITSTTEIVNPRIKGRQISVRVESDALSDHWRMGTMRIGGRPHGRK